MRTLLVAIITIVISGCGAVPYTMDAPDQFKKYADKDTFKMITADGVMLKARAVDNYPVADLPFWTDATKRHLEQSGYTHEVTDCFETNDKLEGCTLRFALPHGAEDWIFQETLFVVNDETIILVEATGEFNKFKAVEEDLNKALKTFRPNL